MKSYPKKTKTILFSALMLALTGCNNSSEQVTEVETEESAVSNLTLTTIDANSLSTYQVGDSLEIEYQLSVSELNQPDVDIDFYLVHSTGTENNDSQEQVHSAHLLAMTKEKQETDSSGNLLKRTQHSTFNAGQSVANAGVLEFNKDSNALQTVRLSSGHYSPSAEDKSAIKMAIWADKHNAFDTHRVDIMHKMKKNDKQYVKADVSPRAQVKAVLDWAKRNNN